MPKIDSPALRGFTPATKALLPFAYAWHFSVWNWPVLPVMPWVMTLVSWLMYIDILCAPGLSNGGHDALRGVGHGVCGDDRQAGLGQQFLARLLVGALHAHDQRHGQVHGLAGADHAGGDGVAAHDAAEDVDQDAFDLGVAEHDLEGFGDLLCRGATAHVQEVGRRAAEQLDGVHRGHGQAGAVDQAADVAVHADVGQVELRGQHFGRVFFPEIAVGHDLGVAPQRVGVEVALGVERGQPVLAVAVQRVDLQQRCVGVHVALVEPAHDVHGLGLGWRGQADADGDLERLLRAQARPRIDEISNYHLSISTP